MQAVFLYLFFIPFAALQLPQVFPLQNCQLCMQTSYLDLALKITYSLPTKFQRKLELTLQ